MKHQSFKDHKSLFFFLSCENFSTDKTEKNCFICYDFVLISDSSFGFDSLAGFSFADLAKKTEGFAFGNKG